LPMLSALMASPWPPPHSPPGSPFARRTGAYVNCVRVSWSRAATICPTASVAFINDEVTEVVGG
jgi:hypothetical protein